MDEFDQAWSGGKSDYGTEVLLSFFAARGDASKALEASKGLINAGHDMVKEVFPNAAVMVHLAQPQTSSNITPMLRGFFGNGG